jgi:hypothetical protein
MSRIVKLSSKDPKQIDLLLQVALEMGISVSVENDDTDNLVQEPTLTYEQKKVLDERRATTRKEDFIPWDKAKEQLKTRKK